jgi:hypothetical protein
MTNDSSQKHIRDAHSIDERTNFQENNKTKQSSIELPNQTTNGTGVESFSIVLVDDNDVVDRWQG